MYNVIDVASTTDWFVSRILGVNLAEVDPEAFWETRGNYVLLACALLWLTVVVFFFTKRQMPRAADESSKVANRAGKRNDRHPLDYVHVEYPDLNYSHMRDAAGRYIDFPFFVLAGRLKELFRSERFSEYLMRLRWPRGFTCPRCGGQRTRPSRRGLLRCGQCD